MLFVVNDPVEINYTFGVHLQGIDADNELESKAKKQVDFFSLSAHLIKVQVPVEGLVPVPFIICFH